MNRVGVVKKKRLHLVSEVQPRYVRQSLQLERSDELIALLKKL